MRGLLGSAFSFVNDNDQLEAPSWTQAEHFDIAAESSPNTPVNDLREMLKNLLIERFHLEYHIIQKSFEVYSLSVAKGGSKLPAAAPPDGPQSANVGGRTARDAQGFAILAPGYKATSIEIVNGTEFRINDRMVTIGDLLVQIRSHLQVPLERILDRTALSGTYDIRLKFYEGLHVAGFGGNSPDEPADASPELSKALEQQLGLRLEKSKAPLDVVVIDHLDKMPSEN